MAVYGWTGYDIRTGGIHLVNDTGNKLDLVTQFSKTPEGNWGLRVRALPRADAHIHQHTTLVFYLGLESAEATLNCEKREIGSVACAGRTNDLGKFNVLILDHQPKDSASSATSVHGKTVAAEDIWQAKSILADQLKHSSRDGLLEDKVGQGNLQFVQKTFEETFGFDVLFSSDSDSSTQMMTSDALTKEISIAHSRFEERFGFVYAPQHPFQSGDYDRFSQHLISNLMGGIGYFQGKSRVDTSSALEYSEADLNFWEKAASARAHAIVEEQGPYQLFTAVPSRPFFPRGFLWDEGFHLQVVLDWDMDLALEIVSSWFDLMDKDGWIAREQILGPEARSKVPPEFQVQYPHYANPPTLFLVVEAFLARLNEPSSYAGATSNYLADPTAGKSFLNMIYPKLKTHYR